MKKKLALNPEKPHEWTEKQLFELASALRVASKPILLACNKIDVPGAEHKYKQLKQAFPNYTSVPCSAEAEAALREAARSGLISYIPGSHDFQFSSSLLSEKQKAALEFIRNNVFTPFGSTGVQDVLDKAVFEFLGYIAIFPGGINKLADSNGRVLPDCFLLPRGSTALDFAYKIHTDLGKHFIRAIDVKKKRTVGKDHLLQQGDVIEIISGK